jgi:hypothetical protein
MPPARAEHAAEAKLAYSSNPATDSGHTLQQTPRSRQGKTTEPQANRLVGITNPLGAHCF